MFPNIESPKWSSAFENAISYGLLTEEWTTQALKFPALGKNGEGVFGMEFTGLDAGTYYVAAYAGDKIDTLDILNESAKIVVE